jgi:hypothetical protein
MFIVKIAQKIASYHARFFRWVAARAETNPWFSVLLTVVALYEIAEHILGPTFAVLWALGKVHIG